MRYDYKCPECGWEGERIVSRVADRDNQFCEEPVEDDFGNNLQDDLTCGAALVREEISLTARMSSQWAQ